MGGAPEVKAVAAREYKIKQSKYGAHVPVVPFNMIICAPSNSGKPTLLLSMLTDIYPLGRVFERIYVWSHSIFVDDAWKGFIRSLEAHGLDPAEHCFDSWDEEKAQEILDLQTRIVKHQKAGGSNRLFSICFVLDDLLDSREAMRNSRTVEMLFCRGRHLHISCLCSVQKYRVLNPVVRVNASDLVLFFIRNRQDLDAILEELSALAPKREVELVYRHAVETPHGFLWINLRAKTLGDFFSKSFQTRLVLKNTSEGK